VDKPVGLGVAANAALARYNDFYWRVLHSTGLWSKVLTFDTTKERFLLAHIWASVLW